MMTKDDWNDALDTWIDSEGHRLGGSPTPEEVVAYLRGELSAADAARVRALLVYDPALTPLLQERTTNIVPFRRRLLPIAAALVIALQTVLLIQSRVQIAQMNRPFAHESRHELEAVPLTRGPAPPPPVTDLPAGEARYLLALPVDEPSSRIDLVDRSGVVWSETEVRPIEGSIELEIPGKFLRPGSYRIDVYGEGHLVKRFAFRVR